MERLSIDDLQHILDHTESIWSNVNGKTFFITGGTGFFGKWLLSSFIYINEKKGLNNKAIVLTRDKSLFLATYPHYNNPQLTFLEGDISSFDFPENEIDYIIHAATEASATLNAEQPILMFDTIVDGTKRILELARSKKVKAVLHTSSGAVYGEQPTEITHLTEEYVGAPDVLAEGSAYGEGKRVAEMMTATYYKKFAVPSKIARCYAFSGPYLPMDAHFAIGNFIQNVLNGKDIIVKGDGTPRRSYLYAADLTAWLWTILFKGKVNYAYNVGSDEDVSIKELALMVSGFSNSDIEVKILGETTAGTPVKRYVPSISRAKADMGLTVNIDLEEAIRRTLAFNNYEFKGVLSR